MRGMTSDIAENGRTSPRPEHGQGQGQEKRKGSPEIDKRSRSKRQKSVNVEPTRASIHSNGVSSPDARGLSGLEKEKDRRHKHRNVNKSRHNSPHKKSSNPVSSPGQSDQGVRTSQRASPNSSAEKEAGEIGPSPLKRSERHRSSSRDRTRYQGPPIVHLCCNLCVCGIS